MKRDLFGICPVRTAQKIISGKWTLLILFLLNGKTMRFNELQKELGNLTQATLTKQLRLLEADGLIIRKAYNQIPPKVEYSLSPLGQDFAPVLTALEVWGNQYIDYLNSQAGNNFE